MTTPPRVRLAGELLAELPQLLQLGGLPEPETVLTTMDGRDLDKLDGRGGIILVHPAPALTWPMPGVTEATWTLDLVAAHPDVLEAWARLDAIVHALRVAGLAMTEATPGMRKRTAPAPDLPGYIVTVTHQHLD